MTAFMVEREGSALWIAPSDDSSDGPTHDERGTFLHVLASPRGNPSGSVAYVRMGDNMGRRLNAAEATAVRDALTEFIEAAK